MHRPEDHFSYIVVVLAVCGLAIAVTAAMAAVLLLPSLLATL